MAGSLPRPTFRDRVREHGLLKALLESFAYEGPQAAAFGKTVPLYAESWWYAMGGLAFLSFAFLGVTGLLLAAAGPYAWLETPAGRFLRAAHYWSAQAFFFFTLLHGFRAWVTGAFRSRLGIWVTGVVLLFVAYFENLFGLVARGDWESQFVAIQVQQFLFSLPLFGHAVQLADGAQALLWHAAVLPLVLLGLLAAHLRQVRRRGVAPALDASRVSSAPVRHAYWKYPPLALGAAGLVAGLALSLGAPDSPRLRVADVATEKPRAAAQAFAEELSGRSATGRLGVRDPARTYVLAPIAEASWALGPRVRRALRTWERATPAARAAWLAAYRRALEEKKGILPAGRAFGPVADLVGADLRLARTGFLDQALERPGRGDELATLWLADSPVLAQEARRLQLTDDQWGMLRQRGFPVGMWYLVPAGVIRNALPGGRSGTGFVLWLGAFLVGVALGVPLLPGLRELPERLGWHRWVYRHPTVGGAAEWRCRDTWTALAGAVLLAALIALTLALADRG